MYTRQQKINHLKVLYHAAISDGIYSKAEAIYIRRVAENLGVDIENIEYSGENRFDLELPEKEYLLYSLFHRLALIALVDNEMTSAERHFCLDMGIRMGLHPQAVNEVLDLIVKEGAFNTTPEAIIDVFIRYSN
ncbi:MAG: hypothetical protein AAFN93_04160 [Bacteroidota bacterium]